jgi:sortase A
MNAVPEAAFDSAHDVTAPEPMVSSPGATPASAPGPSPGKPRGARMEPGERRLGPGRDRSAGRKRNRAPDSGPSRSRRGARALGRTLRGVGWQAVALPMVTLSVLALWAVLYGLVFSSLQEHRSQHELLATFQEQLAVQTAPVTDPIHPGAPVATLSIPGIGLHDVVVVEGTDSADLEAGPGHRRDTVLPGQVGVSVLMGRSLLFGAPFGHIVDLRTGAPITVLTGQGSFRYRVTDVRRDGDRLPYPIPDGSGRLTLVTSAPANGGVAPSRQTVYVDATLQGHAQGASTGRPASIANSEAPMRGEVGSLPVLVIWMALLVVALVLAAWARTSWRLKPTVLVAVPVVIALVWAITELAAQFLPNLL